MKITGSVKIPSLRSFITVTISFIVTLILLCAASFYYIRTDSILTTSYQRSIISQFSQVNQKITEQVDSINSIIPLYVSNASIANVLDTAYADNISKEGRIAIEKQMTDTYYSTPLSARNFTNAIYIANKNGAMFSIGTSASLTKMPSGSREILEDMDKKEHRLLCRMLPEDEDNIYFARNLYSGNTGNYNGTIIIAIDRAKWLAYCVKGLDTSWFICLYNTEFSITSSPDMEKECQTLQTILKKRSAPVSFEEVPLCGRQYFISSQNLNKIPLSSAVIAPKSVLFKDLNDTLKTYLLLMASTVFLALFTAIIISRAITRPIDRMIYHINQISEGRLKELPPMKMYQEFNIWADSFNQMLKQLDTYYNDSFQKQLLLKSSEIRALQSQMNPHFLFNVLNTIAWKAQMSGDEEIYQMIISLGELLKMNTLSKEKDFIMLRQEIEYIKFYVYLQQMRFEDKISCVFQIPESLMTALVPAFCIQPLVENAIIHGLEPKDGKGRLIVQIFQSEEDFMEISIIDNGIGFEQIPDVRQIKPSGDGSHTHVGLRNLDKRLELLFGSDSRLQIDSIPEKYTAISFKLPIRRKEE